MRHGRDALARGAWEEARRAFEAALRDAVDPEALEGLGTACWFLDDGVRVIEVREEAYRLYYERGDRLGAARVALSLYWDYRAFRGDAAVSNGWLRRAERLLEGMDSTREYGWLRYRQAQAALFGDRDPAAARAHTAVCRTIGRGQGWTDLEIGALALDGLAFVTEGDPAAGRRCMDEAMTAIVGGEVTDLTIIGLASCHLIAACERTHDYERATLSCERLEAFCVRWRIRPLFAVCRTLYAAICLSRGTWQCQPGPEQQPHRLAARPQRTHGSPSCLEHPQQAGPPVTCRRRRRGCAIRRDLILARSGHRRPVPGHGRIGRSAPRPPSANMHDRMGQQRSVM